MTGEHTRKAQNHARTQRRLDSRGGGIRAFGCLHACRSWTFKSAMHVFVCLCVAASAQDSAWLSTCHSVCVPNCGAYTCSLTHRRPHSQHTAAAAQPRLPSFYRRCSWLCYESFIESFSAKNKNQVSFLRMDVRRRELLVHQKQDAHSKQSKPTRGATLFSKPTRGATSALNPAALRQHLPSSTP